MDCMGDWEEDAPHDHFEDLAGWSDRGSTAFEDQAPSEKPDLPVKSGQRQSRGNALKAERDRQRCLLSRALKGVLRRFSKSRVLVAKALLTSSRVDTVPSTSVIKLHSHSLQSGTPSQSEKPSLPTPAETICAKVKNLELEDHVPARLVQPAFESQTGLRRHLRHEQLPPLASVEHTHSEHTGITVNHRGLTKVRSTPSDPHGVPRLDLEWVIGNSIHAKPLFRDDPPTITKRLCKNDKPIVRYEAQDYPQSVNGYRRCHKPKAQRQPHPRASLVQSDHALHDIRKDGDVVQGEDDAALPAPRWRSFGAQL